MDAPRNEDQSMRLQRHFQGAMIQYAPVAPGTAASLSTSSSCVTSQHHHQAEEVQSRDDNEDEDEDEDEEEDPEKWALHKEREYQKAVSKRIEEKKAKEWPKTLREAQALKKGEVQKHLKAIPIPASRMRRIIKGVLDDNVLEQDEKGRGGGGQMQMTVNNEVPLLMAKACELLITDMSTRAMCCADVSKRSCLQRCDIARGLSLSDIFDFLIDIVPREYMHIKSKRGQRPAFIPYMTVAVDPLSMMPMGAGPSLISPRSAAPALNLAHQLQMVAPQRLALSPETPSLSVPHPEQLISALAPSRPLSSTTTASSIFAPLPPPSLPISMIGRSASTSSTLSSLSTSSSTSASTSSSSSTTNPAHQQQQQQHQGLASNPFACVSTTDLPLPPSNPRHPYHTKPHQHQQQQHQQQQQQQQQQPTAAASKASSIFSTTTFPPPSHHHHTKPHQPQLKRHSPTAGGELDPSPPSPPFPPPYQHPACQQQQQQPTDLSPIFHVPSPLPSPSSPSSSTASSVPSRPSSFSSSASSSVTQANSINEKTYSNSNSSGSSGFLLLGKRSKKGRSNL